MRWWLGQKAPTLPVDVKTKPISVLLAHGPRCCQEHSPGLTGLLDDGGFSVGVRWGRRILIAPCAKKNRAKMRKCQQLLAPKSPLG